ncbi:hypothetical protein BDZ91DRAFT_727577 [Kalaharituber pfeilii]|nr:hypothetical protein BDZ91DRAFT_727577 [Kalaharituber pfeilii]
MASSETGDEGARVTEPPALHYYESEFFRIIIDDTTLLQRTEAGRNVPVDSDQDTSIRRTFYIHKALLSSISPELMKHVENDMREGRKGEMIVQDVSYLTMKNFIDWAYAKTYNVLGKGANALLPHLQLYVFGDRFNIPELRKLACQEVKNILTGLKLESDSNKSHEADIFITAFDYALENLFFQFDVKSLEGSKATESNPIGLLTNFLVASMHIFRKLPAFHDLLRRHLELTIMLIAVASWDNVGLEAGKTNTKHPLLIRCKNCGWMGIGSVKCTKCNNIIKEPNLYVTHPVTRMYCTCFGPVPFNINNMKCVSCSKEGPSHVEFA